MLKCPECNDNNYVNYPDGAKLCLSCDNHWYEDEDPTAGFIYPTDR